MAGRAAVARWVTVLLCIAAALLPAGGDTEVLLAGESDDRVVVAVNTGGGSIVVVRGTVFLPDRFGSGGDEQMVELARGGLPPVFRTARIMTHGKQANYEIPLPDSLTGECALRLYLCAPNATTEGAPAGTLTLSVGTDQSEWSLHPTFDGGAADVLIPLCFDAPNLARGRGSTPEPDAGRCTGTSAALVNVGDLQLQLRYAGVMSDAGGIGLNAIALHRGSLEQVAAEKLERLQSPQGKTRDGDMELELQQPARRSERRLSNVVVALCDHTRVQLSFETGWYHQTGTRLDLSNAAYALVPPSQRDGFVRVRTMADLGDDGPLYYAPGLVLQHSSQMLTGALSSQDKDEKDPTTSSTEGATAAAASAATPVGTMGDLVQTYRPLSAAMVTRAQHRVFHSAAEDQRQDGEQWGTDRSTLPHHHTNGAGSSSVIPLEGSKSDTYGNSLSTSAYVIATVVLVLVAALLPSPLARQRTRHNRDLRRRIGTTVRRAGPTQVEQARLDAAVAYASCMQQWWQLLHRLALLASHRMAQTTRNQRPRPGDSAADHLHQASVDVADMATCETDRAGWSRAPDGG